MATPYRSAACGSTHVSNTISMHLPETVICHSDGQKHQLAGMGMPAHGHTTLLLCTKESSMGETYLRDHKLADMLLASFRQAEH